MRLLGTGVVVDSVDSMTRFGCAVLNAANPVRSLGAEVGSGVGSFCGNSSDSRNISVGREGMADGAELADGSDVGAMRDGFEDGATVDEE